MTQSSKGCSRWWPNAALLILLQTLGPKQAALCPCVICWGWRVVFHAVVVVGGRRDKLIAKLTGHHVSGLRCLRIVSSVLRLDGCSSSLFGGGVRSHAKVGLFWPSGGGIGESLARGSTARGGRACP